MDRVQHIQNRIILKKAAGLTSYITKLFNMDFKTKVTEDQLQAGIIKRTGRPGGRKSAPLVTVSKKGGYVLFNQAMVNSMFVEIHTAAFSITESGAFVIINPADHLEQYKAQETKGSAAMHINNISLIKSLIQHFRPGTGHLSLKMEDTGKMFAGGHVFVLLLTPGSHE